MRKNISQLSSFRSFLQLYYLTGERYKKYIIKDEVLRTSREIAARYVRVSVDHLDRGREGTTRNVEDAEVG